MTDTLRDRMWRSLESHGIGWIDNGKPDVRCLCGHHPSRLGASWHVHVADAILAIPGIAVVELPEPDHHEPATECVNGYVEWRYVHGSVATTDDGTIMWERWHITDPSKVRAAAAALLAAAEYAERDQ